LFAFFNNISAKYYENPTMLSRVIAKNIVDVFFETQCSLVFDSCINNCISNYKLQHWFQSHSSFCLFLCSVWNSAFVSVQERITYILTSTVIL